MPWSEVDLDKKLIDIPAERMKRELAHTVPMAPMMFELVMSLPRFTGPCLFSVNGGKTSFRGFHKAKLKLDKLSGVTDWVIHDLRRTMRSSLPPLGLDEVLCERMIAHRPKGVAGIYNRYAYDKEKRAGYEKYEAALSQVLLPKQAAA